jgi:methylenetetrahydrofolate dehydrogenase (NADP+)/methenyltetrahydrofolate cyclohydrolase
VPASIIDGNALASTFRQRISQRVVELQSRGRQVRLDAVLAETGDTAARLYADNQARTCEALGIDYRLHRILPEAGGAPIIDAICERIESLSDDESVSAIMLHMPLPEGVDPYRAQCLIAPEKDVEGVNPANIGNIVYGRSSLAPCTALAVLKLIEHVVAPEDDLGCAGVRPGLLRGRLAVCIGAGDVVGKPIAVLLMRSEATVISCNKYTPNVNALAREADVLVAAAGVPGLVKSDMVKPGAIVIDVGVSRVPGPDGRKRTVGDVDFASVRERAGHITPVPGGVGPMTVAMLLHNVVQAAERRLNEHRTSH